MRVKSYTRRGKGGKRIRVRGYTRKNPTNPRRKRRRR